MSFGSRVAGLAVYAQSAGEDELKTCDQWWCLCESCMLKHTL